MSKKQYPPIEFVRQALREENNKLYWVERPQSHFATKNACGVWNSRFVGKEAGSLLKDRWMICISGHYILRYHIIWAFHYDEWPSQPVDHKDRDALNDSIDNLRLCTMTQNNGNTTIGKNNTSGFKGVSWLECRKMWLACIFSKGKRKYLGRFRNPVDAHRAYMKAAIEKWGEFACSGEPINRSVS